MILNNQLVRCLQALDGELIKSVCLFIFEDSASPNQALCVVISDTWNWSPTPITSTVDDAAELYSCFTGLQYEGSDIWLDRYANITIYMVMVTGKTTLEEMWLVWSNNAGNSDLIINNRLKIFMKILHYWLLNHFTNNNWYRICRK